MTGPALAVDNVSKRFGGIQALRDVSLSVEAGSILGLVGPNGSGKSTLLGIIAGRVRPDNGSVIVGGAEHAGFHQPRAARRVGIELMPQEVAIVDGMSVTDNICLGDEPHSRGLADRRAAQRSAREALRLVGLETPVDAMAGSLSAAEKRMLMLARTLHRQAKVIIIDEPSAGLAPADAGRVGDAVRRVRDAGGAVIYVSHYLDEVAGLADRAIGLRDGHVVSRLETGQVTKSALLDVILGSPLTGAAGAIAPVQSADTSGGIVLRVEPLRSGRAAGTAFHVCRGEIVGLAGLLGSGRTDIVAAVTGVAEGSARSVFVNGKPAASPIAALAAGLGHLSGDRTQCVIPSLDLTGHVTLPVLRRFSRWGLMRRSKEFSAAQEALAATGIHAQVKYLQELSGGNQQRALMARWLLADVDILVVDEPTVGVDVKARALILAQLQELGRRKALLISSSEPEELVAISDRVLCFKDGRCVAEARGPELSVDFITAAIS
jgi:ABC-type sugar transport system ATPase subunit